MIALQDQYAPQNRCFGCGPANELGLQIKSEVSKDGAVVAFWRPKAHHSAFDNVLSGGICGTLLDCHSNWTAAYYIMKHRQENSPPCTVTAHYEVTLLAPTPMNSLIKISAHPTLVTDSKALVEATLQVEGKITAKCKGTFVAVKEGHPAFHRW